MVKWAELVTVHVVLMASYDTQHLWTYINSIWQANAAVMVEAHHHMVRMVFRRYAQLIHLPDQAPGTHRS